MRFQFTCRNCGENSDVDASLTTVTPSWVVVDCLSCETRCARTADGWRRLALVVHGAGWVGEDPLTEWDVDSFVGALELCDPAIQARAETA